MSLRDQLLKSGLASKQQAKRAERDVKKRQHEELTSKKQKSIADAGLDPEIQKMLAAQREADRELNRQIEIDKQKKEARARGIDIMMHGDLCDPRAQQAYYFRYGSSSIGQLRVNEIQQIQLAQGQLAIASFDPEYKFFLISPENAAKILLCDPTLLLCHHTGQDKSPLGEKEAEDGDASMKKEGSAQA